VPASGPPRAAEISDTLGCEALCAIMGAHGRRGSRERVETRGTLEHLLDFRGTLDAWSEESYVAMQDGSPDAHS
jgi:hypothetical protein